MTKEEFKGEVLYQTTMHLVGKLLADGVITTDEYKRMETVFIEKYSPIFATLFSEIRAVE